MNDHNVPLVAKFRTSQFNYVYDANTGYIAQVDDALFDVLQEEDPFDLCVSELGGLTPSAQDVGKRRQDEVATSLGLFKPPFVRSSLAHPTRVKQALGRLSDRFSRMTLNVTDRCNLRCRYCPYSLGIKGMRSHGYRDMSWDTAKAACDYFLDHLIQDAPWSLGFYGGEPCLRPDLIERCIDYVSTREPAVSYSCTTNGTLLTPDITAYFAAHRLMLLISLDGPPDVHDRNRPNLKGAGSFDRIWANINELRERHAEYYQTSVRFFATVSTDSDYERVFEFFLSHPNLFGANQVRISPDRYAPNTGGAGISRLLRRYEDKVLAGTIGDDCESTLLQSMFERTLLTIYRRRISLEGIRPPFRIAGSCFPGYGRIFVGTDGAFYLCEKVDNCMVFGSVGSGTESERVMKLYDLDWKRREHVCSRCWAIGLCGRCYSFFKTDTGGCKWGLDPQECSATVKMWRQALIRYCSILERNSNAFDHLRDDRYMGPGMPDLAGLEGRPAESD